jgi:hypothetical protein
MVSRGLIIDNYLHFFFFDQSLVTLPFFNTGIIRALYFVIRYYAARSVKTMDPEMREIFTFTLWPGFAFATYII